MAAMSLPIAELPSDEELDLATYKAGSFISDLEWFGARLTRDVPKTIEEFNEREKAGTLPPAVLDRDQLAAIVVFATECLTDADAIREYATTLQREALALYRDQPFDGELHWQRVEAWHLAEAAKRQQS